MKLTYKIVQDNAYLKNKSKCKILLKKQQLKIKYYNLPVFIKMLDQVCRIYIWSMSFNRHTILVYDKLCEIPFNE